MTQFARRREDFGFADAEPWSLDALRLLFHTPRVFKPLAEAWEAHHPGTLSALDRLTELGFVTFQEPVTVDTRSQDQTDTATRSVDRFRLTAAGHRLLKACKADPAELRVRFRRITDSNIEGVIELLKEFAVDSTRARDGRSIIHFAETGPLPRRTAYFWCNKLVDAGYLRLLPQRAPDAKDAIPAHWRINRTLSTQLKNVFEEFPQWNRLSRDFRLNRTRYLGDIELSRVSMGGGTDYDHDVVTQSVFADMLESQSIAMGAPIRLEPKYRLTVSNQERPWTFDKSAVNPVYYQPDAIFTASLESNVLCALEYERLQSRRKAWGHIERFLGYLAQTQMPFVEARLLFVVDTERREQGYVELIEAFADWAHDNPHVLPPNKVTLAVSSRHRLDDAKNPLANSAWFRVALPTGDGTGCVLHSVDHSPLLNYFESD